MDFVKQNSAQIKNILILMNKETFIKHAKQIKLLAQNFELNFYNENLKMKYLGLYRFCVMHYYNKFSV